MKKVISKGVVAAAIGGGLLVLSTGAMAQVGAVFPDFVVNEGSVPSAVARQFTADKMTGNYTEVISFGANNTFNVSLLWQAGQFVANDGTMPVASQLGAASPNQYDLYALYRGNGTFATSSGGVTNFSFTPGGSLRLFIDPNSDTGFVPPANGSTDWTTTNSGDDYLIVTGTPTSGQGTLDPSLSTCSGTGGNGIDCGSFGASSTWSLTAAGSQYFTTPNPFYNVSFQSGQLNNFTLTGTQTINGSLDVVFGQVPEPASVALLGLGLMGVIAARRKQT